MVHTRTPRQHTHTHTHTKPFAMARVEWITCQRIFAHRAILSGFATVNPPARDGGGRGSGLPGPLLIATQKCFSVPTYGRAHSLISASHMGRFPTLCSVLRFHSPQPATTTHGEGTSLGTAESSGAQAKVCMVCCKLSSLFLTAVTLKYTQTALLGTPGEILLRSHHCSKSASRRPHP